MMDKLEQLKQDWKRQEKNLPHFSTEEIYLMMKRKSTSIVKWIFIISLIELLVGSALNVYLADDQFWNRTEHIHLKTATYIIYAVSYIITFIFIYFFYKNYRVINASENVSQLMKRILKTRKIVKYYILYVLISSGVVGIVYFVFSLLYPPRGAVLDLNQTEWVISIAIGIGVIVLIVLFIWLVYSLIYGLLLRKLNHNYKELKRLELK